MNKAKYMEIHRQLDFKPRQKWLIGHILTDAVLLGLPIGLTWGFGLGWNGGSVLRCLLSSVLLAIFYFRSFSMMHDAVHGALVRNRRVNNILGVIYGAACFLPFYQWREIHLLHHYWSGNVEKDPVRRITVMFRENPTWMTRMMSLFWPTWLPVAAVIQNWVFWSASVVRFDRKKGNTAVLSLALPLFAWGFVFLIAELNTALFLILPSIVVYLAMVEMVNFPHHTDLPQHEGDTKFALWEQHKTARSCFYPKMFERYVLLNFNYHIEHHLYPTLPWYHLEALSTVLRREIPDYFYSEGNDWVVRNRQRPFREVCLSENGENPSQTPRKTA